MNGLASLAGEVIARSRLLDAPASAARFFELATRTSVASDSLTAGAEEALHTVQTASILLSHRLCLALTALTIIAVIEFLMGCVAT